MKEKKVINFIFTLKFKRSIK